MKLRDSSRRLSTGFLLAYRRYGTIAGDRRSNSGSGLSTARHRGLQDMKEYQTEQIRNVVVLGHGGTGKTSFTEAALFATGAINRLGHVDDGNTTSDYDPDEVKRQISISLSLLPCEWSGHKVTLIDTPGYADFLGEVREGVRAADAALVVVDAVSGVEVGTDLAWEYADEGALPRLLFVNRIDRENADFLGAVRQVRE